jgi:hypothetical protein
VDFTGGDQLITFENRHKGLSIFSLAPLEDFGDEGNRRDLMLHYEESTSQHGPADRANFASLSSVVVSSPTTRDRLLRWVDHCGIQITIFLGPMCRLIAPLAQISRLLLDPSSLSGFCSTDCLILLWMLHKAIRCFFLQHSTIALERIVAGLEAGIRYSHENLPSQMRPPPIVSDGSSAGSRSVASDLTGPLYGYSEARDSKRHKHDPGALFSLRLRQDITRAAMQSNQKRSFFIFRNCPMGANCNSNMSSPATRQSRSWTALWHGLKSGSTHSSRTQKPNGGRYRHRRSPTPCGARCHPRNEDYGNKTARGKRACNKVKCSLAFGSTIKRQLTFVAKSAYKRPSRI